MKEQKAILLLLLTSFIWGFAFVAQSVSSETLGPFAFNGIRNLLGALTLLPFVLPKLRKASVEEKMKTAKGGVICGIFLCAAIVTQQYGVAISGASKGGFITSLYIIIVPFLSALLGQRIKPRIWLSAVLGILGMYLLSFRNGFSVSTGDLYLIASAFLFAIHILVIDRNGKDSDSVTLSMFQFLTAGVIATAVGLILERPALSAVTAQWLPIIYAGVFSCGVAYTLQAVGQKHVNPSKAVFALSLESVWAAIGGALLLGERLSGQELIGCAVMFAAVIIAELGSQSSST